MSTQKAITQHGEVEYETIKCDSCGNEVVEGEETSYIIGEIKELRNRMYEKKVYFEKEGFKRGNLCPHCAEARNLDIRHSNDEQSKSSNIVSGIVSGVRNAHSRCIEKMIKGLNADEMVGGYDEPDIVTGLLYLMSYVFVIFFVIVFVLALI